MIPTPTAQLRRSDQSNLFAARSRQREHWDNVSLAMPDLFPAASTQYYRRCEIALIQRSLGTLRGKRVLKLDLWNEALNTRILHWMQSEGAEVVGLDISGTTTRRARHNSVALNGAMQLLQADIRNLPFQTGSFHFVYTMGTIEHIDEYDEAVREIQRVLKSGGKAIIGVPHKWDVFLRPWLVQFLSWLDRYPYFPERSFSSGELHRVVEQTGLHVEQRTGLLASPAIIRMADCFLYRHRNPLRNLCALLLRPFEFLELRYPWIRRFGYLLVVVAGKDAARARTSS